MPWGQDTILLYKNYCFFITSSGKLEMKFNLKKIPFTMPLKLAPKSSTMKITKHCTEKLKKTQIKGVIAHTHFSEDLVCLKCNFSPKCSMDSMISLSNSQQDFLK